MIPKVIHYCWFGKNPKSKLINDCIESWKRNLSDYEIKEWGENNFDYTQYKYANHAYQNKKWAFVSDYARLKILYEHGGIYLDTDMYVLKSFNDFLNYDLVLGKEDALHISAGMIACGKNNSYIKKVLDYYDQNTKDFITIPRILTKIFEEHKKELNISEVNLGSGNVKIFEAKYFYPYTADSIKNFKYDTLKNTSNAPKESYAVHMWNYSWGHPLVKFSKKIGAHKLVIKILDKLKIKKILKKIFRTA